jgi:hypothetical protein
MSRRHEAHGDAPGSAATNEQETRDLMLYLAVNLLAVGTVGEQNRAMAFLREATGLPMNTPQPGGHGGAS